jgi:hypothetical protein
MVYQKQKRYKCLKCGRKNFDRPNQPHNCIDGFRKYKLGDSMREINICPICNKVDVDNNHIKQCHDYDRQSRVDNIWKQ